MKKRLLIADDDSDYLFLIKLKAESFGFEVITADSQKEAEMILETFKPDLAIVDLMMENEDSGFILSYKIKRLYPEVPVIIATAVSAETGMSFDPGEGLSEGWIKADLVIDKGIRTEQLYKEIKTLLKL